MKILLINGSHNNELMEIKESKSFLEILSIDKNELEVYIINWKKKPIDEDQPQEYYCIGTKDRKFTP